MAGKEYVALPSSPKLGTMLSQNCRGPIYRAQRSSTHGNNHHRGTTIYHVAIAAWATAHATFYAGCHAGRGAFARCHRFAAMRHTGGGDEHVPFDAASRLLYHLRSGGIAQDEWLAGSHYHRLRRVSGLFADPRES